MDKVFRTMFRVLVDGLPWEPLDEQWKRKAINGQEYAAQRDMAYEAVSFAFICQHRLTPSLLPMVVIPKMYQTLCGTMHKFDLKVALAAFEHVTTNIERTAARVYNGDDHADD